MRGIWWTGSKRPVPKHPYRDTAILYGVLAAIVVVFAAATGGPVVKSVIVAAIVYVGATSYSWWYWYDRIKNKGREDIDRRTRN